MQFDFTQILILVLIGLLFFKETLLVWVGEKFGFKNVPLPITTSAPVAERLAAAVHAEVMPLLKKVENLGNNHIEHVQQGVDKVLEEMTDVSKLLFEIKTTLQNIEKYGVPNRK